MAVKKSLLPKVGKTRIVPMGLKILLIFISLILLSNFATNFISTKLSQKQIIDLNNTIMVQQLKEMYSNSSNQFQIYSYSQDLESCIASQKKVAASGFENPNSVALAVKNDGSIAFLAGNNPETVWKKFTDEDSLHLLKADKDIDGIEEGSINFSMEDGEYFGVYKYQSDWDYFLIRAEKRADLSLNSRRILLYTSIIIVGLTVVFIIIGFIIIRHEFRAVDAITRDLFDMQKKKQLELIDLSDAPNDDITYLAASFNSLSSSVNNLLGTFQKFVSKDVVAKAYSDQGIGLEGSQQELTMLFSDIKSFTYRTETLGNDIIDVLNVHYNRAIRQVHENYGVVGSIIGDAILAIYGTLESPYTKSVNAIKAAWGITKVTAELREIMIKRREEIEKDRKLTESEERIFQAVLLDVGVGVDGGNVFYGNIGSNEHMANTVIGDNVNSASRLEGLTRIYHLPVIVSGYIKDEVEKESGKEKDFIFYEIDTVQVKGKTEGKKIYFPFDKKHMSEETASKYEIFEDGLKAYYEGDWKNARKFFKNCELEVAEVFLERIGSKNAPADWSGIWTMTTK
ncbi:MAG: adenylate/guanylate cyclase domain-containing protein [Treponema sp.]|nr:adenylate/guanylate cyclase domain-containing protein [Treponema sp.]